MTSESNYTTLATALERLKADASLSKIKRAELASAIQRVCSFLGKAPEDVPVAPKHLRYILSRLHPVQAGVNARSLANVKSGLASALRQTGLLPPALVPRPRSVAWVEFLAAAPAAYHAVHLTRFVTYCGVRRIEPHQVSDKTISEYQAHLDSRLIGKEPFALCRETVQTWNCIARAHGPAVSELTPLRSGRYICPPLSTYPSSLQVEFQGYLDRLAHKDIFLEDGPDKPLKPVTIRNIEAALRQYLSALLDAGQKADQLTSLSQIITADMIKVGAKAIHARLSPTRTPTALHGIVSALLAIARHHLHLPDAEIGRIQRIKKQTAVSQSGMTAKNRERLGQFDDWLNVSRLLNLPKILLEQCGDRPNLRSNPQKALIAAAICILTSCPIRVKNLASLDLDRHVSSSGTGKHRSYTIRIDATEVKNQNHIEVRLSGPNSRLLHEYIVHWRHQLSPVPGSALFPRVSDGGPRRSDQIGHLVCDTIYRETGLRVNVHLFRHIAAYLYLNERPGDFESVRRFLGHRRLATTMTFYADLSSKWAHEHYDKVVLSKFTGGRDDD